MCSCRPSSIRPNSVTPRFSSVPWQFWMRCFDDCLVVLLTTFNNFYQSFNWYDFINLTTLFFNLQNKPPTRYFVVWLKKRVRPDSKKDSLQKGISQPAGRTMTKVKVMTSLRMTWNWSRNGSRSWTTKIFGLRKVPLNCWRWKREPGAH